MLPGKGRARRQANLFKFLAVVVKSYQSIFELRQRFLGNDIMAGNITKLQECSETPYNPDWNMVLKSRKVDLERYSVHL